MYIRNKIWYDRVTWLWCDHVTLVIVSGQLCCDHESQTEAGGLSLSLQILAGNCSSYLSVRRMRRLPLPYKTAERGALSFPLTLKDAGVSPDDICSAAAASGARDFVMHHSGGLKILQYYRKCLASTFTSRLSNIQADASFHLSHWSSRCH